MIYLVMVGRKSAVNQYHLLLSYGWRVKSIPGDPEDGSL